MRFAVAFAAALLLAGAIVAPSGCQSTCLDGGCTTSAAATFQASCRNNDLVSVVASAPCIVDEGGVSWGATTGIVDIGSASPGTCHVELTFASGFVYSADVAFASQAGACGCPSYVGPTGGQWPAAVGNPSATCLDGGPD